MLSIVISCEEFVEIDPPKDQIAHHLVFNDDQMAVAAMNQAYVLLLNNGFLSGNIMSNGFMMGCLTDELEVTTTENTDYRLLYNSNVTSSNNALKSLWNQTYQQIYIVNNILEGLKTATGMSDSVKEQLKGEALTIRGLLHFYLTQTFGNVPYVTSTDYNSNKSIKKTASEQVVNTAINDLEVARGILSDQYPSKERVRISKKVAEAFLSRMYLYSGEWILAKHYAEIVLQDSNYLLEPLEKVFLKESKSAIWQLKPVISGMNTYEAYTYIFFNNPTTAKLSKELLNTFEPSDQRSGQWIQFFGADQKNAHVNKYKKYGFTSVTSEYSIVVRIEEMYLIAAEAAAQISDWQRCNELLNEIRNRAGLSPLELNNINDAITAILKERRVELFCEFGHRFYDLKRRDQLSVLRKVKPEWKDYFNQLPLPENELLLNPNLLPQNEGY